MIPSSSAGLGHPVQKTIRCSHQVSLWEVQNETAVTLTGIRSIIVTAGMSMLSSLYLWALGDSTCRPREWNHCPKRNTLLPLYENQGSETIQIKYMQCPSALPNPQPKLMVVRGTELDSVVSFRYESNPGALLLLFMRPVGVHRPKQGTARTICPLLPCSLVLRASISFLLLPGAPIKAILLAS